MTNIKACPFCGSFPEVVDGKVYCIHLPLIRHGMMLETWNMRPIEDRLRAVIDNLLAEIEEMKEAEHGDI